ncbi:NAD-dependent epimerase/dehydratase family protein [Acetoanaerobium sticklandii]|uniref:NAD-dependent epimerase/dehydratase family protein n=1 Tax=Acetoanaerobium sticklandii TaxID=1511 RepID=UPI003A8ED04E
MKKIIVTGAKGFIGHHCLQYLANSDFEVHALTRSDDQSNSKNIIWHNFNILEDDSSILFQSIKPTHLLHLAWYTEHGKFWNSDENYKWLAATKSLFTQFLNQGGQEILTAGSVAEYQWSSGSLKEDVSPEIPGNIYGECKLEVTNFCRDLISKGHKIKIARLFFPYGPGEPDTKLIPTLINAIKNRSQSKFTDCEQVRDFLYVEDMANAIVALQNSDTLGVVNIGSGQGIKIKSIIELIKDILKKDADLDLGSIPRSPNDPEELIADTDILNNTIGWKAEYTMRQRLEKMINTNRK